MARRFKGLSDLEWILLEDIFFTSDSRSRLMPHALFRYVLNSLLDLYNVVITDVTDAEITL